MKLILGVYVIIMIVAPLSADAQTGFSLEAYQTHLDASRDMSGGALSAVHAPQTDYYTSAGNGFDAVNYAYLDSIDLKYQFTQDEWDLLARNRFMVSERLSYLTVGSALYDVFKNDLPVFVSTDCVLHALHVSYDRILMDLEAAILEPNLRSALEAMDAAIPDLAARYADFPEMMPSLVEVDRYITVARSLLSGTTFEPRIAQSADVTVVLNAVAAEIPASLAIFSTRQRKFDFSQFIPRGHYTQEDYGPTLEQYFRCMMWIGRIGCILTPPPANPWEPPWARDELRSMAVAAVLLDELLDLSGARGKLDENDEIIGFMVGESDNMTTGELAGVLDDLNISAADLNDDATLDAFLAVITSSEEYGQRILSSLIMADPYSPTPGGLPITYLLMGQRFVIDSYVFSNVVYDRLVYQGKKVWRPMPNPLDAMFVLGNDDALPLLVDELDTYHYSSQLSSLRYLVDSYDDDFWEASLYTTWLGALRELCPPADESGLPFFMTTTAWHQEKLNTQLASWAHLRHDTLLYAKQSYTFTAGCSYPHSYVEPYPAFFDHIAVFARRAGDFFLSIESAAHDTSGIRYYFHRLAAYSETLAALARKERAEEPFTDEDRAFLAGMLAEEVAQGCKKPAYAGWFMNLYYIPESPIGKDATIADVHTQATDKNGNPVGRVLHVGVGKLNLGVFLAPSPSDNYRLMAFVGPVLSYYEMITENFIRLTDEEWHNRMRDHTLPERPDWVNSYLADTDGAARPAGRELPGVYPTGVEDSDDAHPVLAPTARVYPNPFNPSTTIEYTVPSDGRVTVRVYDLLGQIVSVLADTHHTAGSHTITWDARNMPSGVYLYHVTTPSGFTTGKMLLIK